MPAPATISLDTPVADLPGVGPSRAKAFAALEVRTLRELLDYFPRDYQNIAAEAPIRSLGTTGIQYARGEIVAVNYVPSHPRPRFEATLDDGTAKLSVVWFNAAYLRTRIHPGVQVRVRGAVKFRGPYAQMVNPKWELVGEETEAVDQDKFRPIYPASAKLPSETIATVIADALPAALPLIEEWLTEPLMASRSLITRAEAYRLIHQPTNLRDAHRARRRLVYDELLLMQIGLGLSKRLQAGRISAPMFRIDKLLDERIRKRFPFELTDAQTHAIHEIVRDLRSGRPMNRLLQGDVGSGKTVVAVYAMLSAIANKLQAAILAPTEVLAEQHFLTLSNLLKDSNVRIELFTSRTKRRDKEVKTDALAAGEIHLAIGTQALIQKDVNFANLGLVVVDEQHKLGVRQRAVLKEKGYSPHYLVMTATPIPRTLALSYFADFDLSTIDTLPPGRQPISTRWLRSTQAKAAYDFIRAQVSLGRQAYVVLPQIEETDATAASTGRSVKAEFERLSAGPLAGLKLAMLHGQMSTDEKQTTMDLFRRGETDVLVATTVIEVGIDVPNSSVMLIVAADRFGLSQLHQLRGRVGRGSEQSHCILLADAANETTESRLNAMTRTRDGFEIAELDLQLRGPGQFFGTRQHGLPEFKLADLSNEMQLLQQARDDALELLDGDPRLRKPEHAKLRQIVSHQFEGVLELAQIG